MSPSAAFREGLRRVTNAPAVVAGMFSVTLLVSLPLGYALHGMIAAHLGASRAAETAASGVNYDWWQEFSSQATGLATTFVPTVAGFAAVLNNLSEFMDHGHVAATIVGVTAAWMVVWSFLSGGVLDRLARGRRTRAHGFFAACGMHFWRLLRLGVMAWIIYAFLFRFVHGWIFSDVFAWLTRDMTVERTSFAVRVLGYALFGALLITCNIIFDYARIRIVVEDRRSAIAAAFAGARFVRRHAAGVLGLYLLNGLAFLLLVAVYGLVAPGAPRAGVLMWIMLAFGELYILGRHVLKLVFYASETAFFQGALAHAAYTAAPVPVWPDSPAAEMIVNADRAVNP
jgi:hypothetical protein